jgi:UDP-N-acetyl-D-glucosamine dehydrogenase
VIEDRVHKSVELGDELLAGSDLVVVLTHHTTIDYQRVVDRAPRVFDTRNATRDVARGRAKIRKL